MDIYKPSKDFNFNLFSLENPQPVQGGSYFTRVVNNNDKPLFIQLPKCTTKQGVVKTNRGLYCDLMYTKNQCDEFIEWVLALEKYLQDKINDKKDLWFTTEITSDDIESMTTPIYRLYKSGKILLIRTTVDVDKSTNEGKCMVYSEDEIKLSVDNITNTVNIIPLIKIEGIKFTSKSFDIEIKLVQSMVLNKEPEIMQTCMIKREDKNNTQDKLLDSSDGDKTKTLHKDMVTNPHYELEQSNITEINSKKITQEQNNEAQSIEASENKEQMNEEEITEAPDIKEPSSEEQFVNETIKEKEEKNILDYENNDDLEKSPIDYKKELQSVRGDKAKKMRAASIEAFLEAKKIKSQYVLDDIEDSDSEDYTDDEVNDF